MPGRRPSIASLMDAMIADGKAETPPKGWFTLTQMSSITGQKRKTIEAALMWGQYQKCPRKAFRVFAEDGRLRSVTHFDTTWKPKP